MNQDRLKLAERVIELSSYVSRHSSDASWEGYEAAYLDYKNCVDAPTESLRERLNAAEVVFEAWRKYGFGHYKSFLAFQQHEQRFEGSNATL